MAKQPTRGKKADKPDKIIDAAMGLAAERGWARISLADIAEAAGVPIVEVYQTFSSKAAILSAFVRRIDIAVLAATEGEEAGAGETTHDRLFDVLMRRFDALAPHKEALRRITRDLPADPMAMLQAMPQLGRSFSWMLAAAGQPSDGLRGMMRVKALLGVWFATMRVWLDDSDPDLSRTMAALDRNLRRANRFCGLTRSRPEPSAAAA